MVESVSISDGQFRLGVVGVAMVLALGIGTVRFCGSVSLPPKPAGLTKIVTGTGTQLLSKSASSPAVYMDYLAKDAAIAGVRTPTIEEMSRKLTFVTDDARHVLEVGQPATTIAGLEIAAVRAGDTIVLEIRNPTDKRLGYFVRSAPVPNTSACNSARPLPFNALVLGKGEREARVECVYRPGMAIAITRVETVELSPLSAHYIMQLPPALLGIEDRIGRGHRRPRTRPGETPCTAMIAQALRNQVETGEIGWRDLVDFYARHRCQTYQFPLEYRAFQADGERGIPAASAGM